jgi:hypothetical protein
MPAGIGSLHRSIAVDGFCSDPGSVRRTEVGPVAPEYLDPLRAGVLDRLGDEVGDVVLATPGHPDVRRGGTGVLADEDVGGGDVEPCAPYAVVV